MSARSLEKAYCVQVHFVHCKYEDLRLQSLREQELISTLWPFSTRGALYTSQLLEKQVSIRVEETAGEGHIFLTPSCLCYWGLDVQRHLVFICERADCVTNVIIAHDQTDGAWVFTRGLVEYIFVKSLRNRETT